MESNRYLWDAEDYARHSSEQYAWALDLIRNLNLDGSENILDLGCGDGTITALLAEKFTAGRVIGVDSAWSMVALAMNRHRGEIAAGPNYLQMDAEGLGFDGFFQIVFSNAMMHWVHNHLAVLKGIHRSLVPGGLCLLQMGGKGNAAQLVQMLDQVMAQPHWQDYFAEFQFPYKFYSVKEYSTFLSAAGLDGKRVELIKKDMQHQGLEGLSGWLRTAWLPYVERVPNGAQETFIAEIVDLYQQTYPPAVDGVIHVPMVRLEVEAVRP